MDNINRQGTSIDLEVGARTTEEQVTHAPSEAKYNLNARSNVRFNDREWIQIQNEHLITGKSIPELLKGAYFSRPPLQVLMPVDERKALFAQMRGVANNWNQAARLLNSGFRKGWNEELVLACEGIAEIRRCLARYCGNH